MSPPSLHALVTGGASGIGRGIARAFARKGYVTWVADVDADGARAVADDLCAAGYEARPLAVDVARGASVDSAVASVEAWFRTRDQRPALSALVNCAGIDLPVALDELDEARYDRVMDVDLKSIYLLTRRCTPLLEEGRGAVVNVSSVMAWYTAPKYVAYTAAKAGVIGMTRALAVELGDRGIRVNAVCPGFIDTPIWQRNLDAMPAQAATAFADRIAGLHPLGRRGTPDDIAKACTFLCSDEASFVTGTHLIVDGGVSLRLVAP